jgi:type II secretory ATPase GspE/PulE/Tfp pilus assembly ATPase PilB-like protein
MQTMDVVLSIIPGSLCIQADVSPLLSQTTLPFNPTRLIFFVSWFYLCLYFVQRAQFSPLVPNKYKSIAYIISLVAGPVLFLFLLTADTIKKSAISDSSIIEIIKQQVQNIIANIRSIKPKLPKKGPAIKLLDSSGRSINEIYGHGSNKKQDSHILDITEQVIAEALDQRASDILIDPTSDSMYKIRLRVDGVLRTMDRSKLKSAKRLSTALRPSRVWTSLKNDGPRTARS